jgi:hypothetical protein
MDKSKAPVFVVGAPRSGTTLLYHTILSSGNFVVYPVESDVFNRIAPAFGDLHSLANRKRLVNTWLESDYFQRTALDPEELRRQLLSECRTPGDFLRIVMDRMARMQGVERWAEKTPTHVLHIPEIKATIPDALVIHIIRDGRDVAVSMDRMGWAWGGSRFPWGREHGVLVAGIYWEWLVKTGRKYGRRLGKDYLEVHYEDLVQDPKGTLRTLSAFIRHDLDYEYILRNAIGAVKAPNSSFGDLVDARAAGFIGRWKGVNCLEGVRLDELLGPVLREFGYQSSGRATWNFTSLRLRAVYPGYHYLKQRLKQSPLGRFFVCRDRLSRGALNLALSKFEAFGVPSAIARDSEHVEK